LIWSAWSAKRTQAVHHRREHRRPLLESRPALLKKRFRLVPVLRRALLDRGLLLATERGTDR
jgi:hypothetical protein